MEYAQWSAFEVYRLIESNIKYLSRQKKFDDLRFHKTKLNINIHHSILPIETEFSDEKE